MSLKRSYTLAFDEELAQRIESYKSDTGLSYTDIFRKAITKLLENNDD